MQYPSFIEVFPSALSPDDCDTLIQLFEKNSSFHHRGMVRNKDDEFVESFKKKVTELVIPSSDEWKPHIEALNKSLKIHLQKYKELYFGLGHFKKFKTDGYYIKKYFNNNEDHYGDHIDTNSSSLAARLFTIQWYLNDVDQGGETEFILHKIKIKPRKGTLIFFPTQWTHPHRAYKPISSPKYVINDFMYMI